MQNPVMICALQNRLFRIKAVSYTHLDVYKRQGWSGSMSARAVIRGELPAGYAPDDIVLGADCMREGNFKDGAVCSYWLHNIWY